jgi:integrase
MAWSELEDGRWTVSGARTKNHRPLVLPLPRQALGALERWPRVVGRKLLFGRAVQKLGKMELRECGFQGWSKAKARLDARLDFRELFDLHDIRRTVETRMAGLGIPKDHVNKVLNHAAGPITETYDHWSYMPEKAAALQRWGGRTRTDYQRA